MHQPAHLSGVLGEQTTHVVVDAGDIGNGGQIGAHRAQECDLVHRQGQTARSQGMGVFGGHWQVQHDLLAQSMRPARELDGIRGVREKGDSDRSRQIHGLHTFLQIVADVIDDEADCGTLEGE